MRIAVLLKDRCQPKKCSMECIKYCPRVRSGDETIIIGEDGKPVISEELCVGCGICVHKCPFEAIKIVGLAQELETDLIHQFSKNGFRLFRLPVPKEGTCVGILGKNGIGKTTAIKILSGGIKPNLGRFDDPPDWDEILEYFKGTALYEHMKKLAESNIKNVVKPQYVDMLPKVMKGRIKDILKNADETGKFDEIVEKFSLQKILDKQIEKREISGGELQLLAIAATFLKDADIYFFDEPSSYLDIYQRLKVAVFIRKLSEKKKVMVVEHDLAVLDFLCDNVHLMYGDEGAYGVVTHPKGVRHAINIYLSGYLKEENIRFSEGIEFHAHPPRRRQDLEPLITFDDITKEFDAFKLEIKGNTIRKGEVIGVVGPNSIGKTTFVKILAGVIEPTTGKIEKKIKVSYKPQYVSSDYDGTVKELLYQEAEQIFTSTFLKEEVFNPLKIKHLLEKAVKELSGGELQRLAIALCLSKEADVYLIDEPSAYLDSEQRMIASKTIRRVVEKLGKSAMIVDHDVYFIDLVSDALMVFTGEPGRHGVGLGPFDLHKGMNIFLKDVGITFRRDEDTLRPRVNKLGSYMDRMQKEIGEYYYDIT
jgi:ATP-binding cassette subfamily E protein 1